MILKKHLPLGAKYFAILGLVALPIIGVAHAHQHQAKAVKAEKVEKSTPIHHHTTLTSHPKLGGVASFNYSFDDTGVNKVRDARKYGDWRFQSFRLNVGGEVSAVDYFVEYGWFRNRLINVISANDPATYGHFTEAYAAHKFSNGVIGQIGNTKVPFGNSHELTYWRNIPFYAGFAENYQTGLKMVYCNCPWNIQVQLGKNSLVNANNAASYFPKVTTGVYNQFTSGATTTTYNTSSNNYSQNNEDGLQLAARVMHTHHFKDNHKVEVGLSGKVGSLYNTISTSRATQWAGALHVNAYFDKFFVQLQYLPYRYATNYSDQVDNGLDAPYIKDTIQLGKDGVLYTIPTKANIFAAGLGYNIPVSWGHVKEVTVYDDYSILSGKLTQKNTKLNVFGFKFNAGPLFVTAEAITGKNMVGVGQDLLPNKFPNVYNMGDSGTSAYGTGTGNNSTFSTYTSDNTDHWKTKFNINIAIKF